MNQVIEKSITRAIAILKACKCAFIIVDEEGSVYEQGNLKLAESEPETERKHAGFYADLYKPLMQDMKQGDVVAVETPEGMEPSGLRSCMGSYANKMWGKQSCITSVNGRTVELLRV